MAHYNVEKKKGFTLFVALFNDVLLFWFFIIGCLKIKMLALSFYKAKIKNDKK